MPAERKRRARTAYILVAVVVLAVFGTIEVRTGLGRFLWMVGTDSVRERLHRTHFVSADWQNRKLVYSKDPIRLRMVDDLLGRRCLVGMTKAEVVKLLGRPDNLICGMWCYYLGPERGWLSIDDEILELTFDPAGRVTSAEDGRT